MKELLEKYFDGNTSLEEERKLKQYFRSAKVDEEMKPFGPLFQAIDNEQVEGVSDEFESNLFAKLDEGAKVVRMNSWRRNILRIAAVGAVLLAAYFALRPTPAQVQEIAWEKYEVTDEELALEETKKALMLLSSKLNRGKNKTAKEVSKTEKVTKYLN